jgi:drug/metabolite transporter (DMT)-like permease
MNAQAKAYLFAGIAIFFWSTVASAFKIALRVLSYMELVMLASLTSLLFFLIFIIIKGKFRSIFKGSWRQYLFSATMGFLNPFLYYIILFKAYSLLPAQVAQPLNMVWPIVLVFLSIPLLKQHIQKRSFIALGVCFAGVYLISTQGDFSSLRASDPLGLVLAVGSSIVWSLFWLYNVRDERDEEVKLFLGFFFASIYIVITNLVLGNLRSWDIHSLGAAAYVGIFEMGLTFLLWLTAMKLTRTTDLISTLVYLAPFLSLVFIHYLVGEQIYSTTVIGLIMIVGGILIQKFPLKKLRSG